LADLLVLLIFKEHQSHLEVMRTAQVH
jgi:hypothetical protein